MTFNSYLFVLLIFPVSVAGFFVIGKYSTLSAKWFLIIISFLFVSFGSMEMGLFLCVCCGINYFLYCLPYLNKKTCMVVGIAINLLFLIYCKYAVFFLNTINSVFAKTLPLPSIFIPLGISFLTFNLISFHIDYYRGVIEKASISDFLLYILYYPKYMQGPLVSFSEFVKQFENKAAVQIDLDNFSQGILRFTLGLTKKLFFASVLSSPVTWAFGNISIASTLDLAIGAICYTFQIYFDFSGYCDMANGISLMMNIKLPENFNSPYRSLSITEFWTRWHITLSNFLKKYVYFPLGGSRKGTLHTSINIMIVFFLSGLWHGSNWTFIVWGLCNGLLSCSERWFHSGIKKIPKLMRWFFTFVFTNILWVLFRSDSLSQFIQFLIRFFSLRSMTLSGGIVSAFELPEFKLIRIFTMDTRFLLYCNIVSMGLILLSSFLICMFVRNNGKRVWKLTSLNAVFFSFLLTYCILSLGKVQEFIYKRF